MNLLKLSESEKLYLIEKYTKETVDYCLDAISTLNEDQKEWFENINSNSKMNLCSPTGAGKGYLMIVDILCKILISEDNVIAIASHRLLLNTQHIEDIIDKLKPYLDKIKIIFVASKEFTVSEDMIELIENSNALSVKRLISNSSTKKDLTKKVNKNKRNKKKTIIISTYHSLMNLSNINIDTIYFDEAHTLASAYEKEDSKSFKDNFFSLTFEKSYFFSATPKDLHLKMSQETDTFLMNNTNIFGKRYGITLSDAIYKGYITKPIIHIATPEKWNEQSDVGNLDNMIKFIIDTYQHHNKLIKENSYAPSGIEGKILIRAKNVTQMWKIYDKLIEKDFKDISIFAGASHKNGGKASYEIDGERQKSKEVHLEKLQKLKYNEKAIVLHVDTLSEGINVDGFTAIMFLSDEPTTLMKLLQNIGRALRLHKQDRDKIRNNEISTENYDDWIKPYSYIILPVYSVESDESMEIISSILEELIHLGVDSNYYVSIGTNISGTGNPTSLQEDYNDFKVDMIEKIDHFIRNIKLKREFVEEIQLSPEDFFKNIIQL